MGFGDRLKLAREAEGMRGEDVGYKLGVTKATVSKWENDKHSPSVEQVRDLCTLLKVSPDWLFEWTRDQLPPDALAEAVAYSRLSAEDKRKWKALRRAMFTMAEH